MNETIVYTDRFGYEITQTNEYSTYTDEYGRRILRNYNGDNKKVEVPEGIQYVFIDSFSRKNVEEVILPESVIEIGARAFRDCKSLKKIKIPESVQNIDEAAFAGCSNLSEIALPSKLEHLSRNAFSGTAIKQIVIPSGIKYPLGPIAADCLELSEAVILNPNMEISNSEFSNCPNLKRLYFDGDIKNLPPVIRLKIDKGKIELLRTTLFDSGDK